MFVSSAQSCDSVDEEPSPSLCSNRMNIKSSNGPYLHIVAARVINSLTGKSKLVYIQLDSGSQVSFVSHDLVRDLNLAAHDKISTNLNTVTGSKLINTDLIKLDLQSLYSGKKMCNVNCVALSSCFVNKESLPHNQDLSSFEHFKDVHVIGLSNQNQVDVILGCDNSHLLHVKEEHAGKNIDEPRSILSEFGWCAIGGRFDSSIGTATVGRVNICDKSLDLLQKKINNCFCEFAEPWAKKDVSQCTDTDCFAKCAEKDKESLIFYADIKEPVPSNLIESCDEMNSHQSTAKPDDDDESLKRSENLIPDPEETAQTGAKCCFVFDLADDEKFAEKKILKHSELPEAVSNSVTEVDSRGCFECPSLSAKVVHCLTDCVSDLGVTVLGWAEVTEQLRVPMKCGSRKSVAKLSALSLTGYFLQTRVLLAHHQQLFENLLEARTPWGRQCKFWSLNWLLFFKHFIETYDPGGISCIAPLGDLTIDFSLAG